MAKLQLQIELNGITDDEFRALCDALERGERRRARASPRAPARLRPRRDGDLRLMRRAWRRPQDAVAQRGGRGGQ